MVSGARATSLEAWRPEVPGIHEVLHAELGGFAYPPHWHDTWTLLLVDGGSVRYDLDGRGRAAAAHTVNVLPPHVVHDGRPGPQGMRKRVLYVDQTWLPDGLAGRSVDAGPLRDPGLAAALSTAHDRLLARDGLAAESAVALAAERVRARLNDRRLDGVRSEPAAARRLRRHLDEQPLDGVTLSEAARRLDRSVPHLVRSFAAAYGMPPHAYVTARRVGAARRMLLEGLRPADVAAAVGFYDQAHLTRHFRRHLGTTPAAFAASGPHGRPERPGRPGRPGPPRPYGAKPT